MKEQWIYEQFSTIDVGDTRLQKRAVDVAIGGVAEDIRSNRTPPGELGKGLEKNKLNDSF